MKREFELNKQYICIFFICILSFFILGEIITTIVLNYSNTISYIRTVPLILVFAYIQATFILLSFPLYNGFDFAIKMSVSRKIYLKNFLRLKYIVLVVFFFLIFILNYLDKSYLNLIFKSKELDTEFEFFLNKVFTIFNVFLAPYIILCLSTFITSIIHKFGRKIFVIINLIICIVVCFIIYISILKQNNSELLNILPTLPIIYYILLAILICSLLFLIGIKILNKEPAKN